MAYGCNLGPETMAQLTERVSYEDIQRITDWYLHDEALRAALADIVNALLALDTTQVWGDGSISSSESLTAPGVEATHSLPRTAQSCPARESGMPDLETLSPTQGDCKSHGVCSPP